MTNDKFKYEVAFSFLKQDEAIAYDLNDRIQDRLSTFIYSKKQEELGGTDGEKQFNDVFFKDSRIVVVLYRNGWGQTTWTRIEETAIKNRAFDSGWDFLFLINLDTSSTLPSWIPKPYIWLDYERFKAEGAIAIIDQKVQTAGGHIRPETIEDRAEKLKRKRTAENEREYFLRSDVAIDTANEEMFSIITELKKIKSQIEDPSTHLRLASSEDTNYSPYYEFSFRGYCLRFHNTEPFERAIVGGQSQLFGVLQVVLYEKSGHQHFDYKEKLIEKVLLKFDRDLLGNNGWSHYENGTDFISSRSLIDKWAKKFIDGLEGKNHS